MTCSESAPPKPDPDADIFQECPVARAFEKVGTKWRLMVLRCLHLWGEQRFSELQETTTADSATLSRVLEELAADDLVTRRLEDRPIATYYSLTEQGEELRPVFDAYEAWAVEWTEVEYSKPAPKR